MVMPLLRWCPLVVVMMTVMTPRTDGLVCVWCNLAMDCTQLINCTSACFVASGVIANRTGVVRGCAPGECNRNSLFLPSNVSLRCCDTDECNRLSILDVVQGGINYAAGVSSINNNVNTGNSAPRTTAFGGGLWWLGLSSLIGFMSAFKGV